MAQPIERAEKAEQAVDAMVRTERLLRAEIKRLRGALREIAEDYVDPREVAIHALGQSI